jgi:trk system potassium uptake protein TrkA
MRVIVVGAGEVGSNIAASLADEHEIVVVDTDPEVVDDLTYSLDVLAIEGNGASLETLDEAGIDEAEMLIASTDDDETNIVTCGTARTTGDVFTVARVRNTAFLDTWHYAEGAFGVDHMVGTNLLTAETIVRVVGLPAAIEVEPFVEGLVQLAEFEIPEDSPVTAKTVAEADQWEALTFAALVRNGDVAIPRGDTAIEAGDKAVVIGTPESVQAFARSVAPKRTPGDAEEIVVVGGSDIGYQTARLLEARGLQPRLIEQDPERARELAEELPDPIVMQHDATDGEFLDSEHVDRADAVVAALDSDEKNLLVSLLAKNMGAERTVSIVENGAYTRLFEEVGIDVAVNPREATAEEIIRFTRAGRIEKLSLIEGRQAEVLEIEVDADSALVDRPIRDAVADLPDGLVIGAISRHGQLVVPRGETVVEAGDHVVLFVGTEVLDDVVAAV